MSQRSKTPENDSISVKACVPADHIDIRAKASTGQKRLYMRERVIAKLTADIEQGATLGPCRALWNGPDKLVLMDGNESREWYAAWCEVNPDKSVPITLVFSPQSLPEVAQWNGRVAKGTARRAKANLAIALIIDSSRAEFDEYVSKYAAVTQWYVDPRVKLGLDPNPIPEFRFKVQPSDWDEVSVPSSLLLLERDGVTPKQIAEELSDLTRTETVRTIRVFNNERGRRFAKSCGLSIDPPGRPREGYCATLHRYFGAPNPQRLAHDPTNTARLLKGPQGTLGHAKATADKLRWKVAVGEPLSSEERNRTSRAFKRWLNCVRTPARFVICHEDGTSPSRSKLSPSGKLPPFEVRDPSIFSAVEKAVRVTAVTSRSGCVPNKLARKRYKFRTSEIVTQGYAVATAGEPVCVGYLGAYEKEWLQRFSTVQKWPRVEKLVQPIARPDKPNITPSIRYALALSAQVGATALMQCRARAED